MDSLYQEELEKAATKKEVNISLDDEGIMKALMHCHAGRSCAGCPYEELDSPRCRDILLNECIGFINRLKAEKVKIFEEIEKLLDECSRWDMLAYGKHYYTDDDDRISKGIVELKKKFAEDNNGNT